MAEKTAVDSVEEKRGRRSASSVEKTQFLPSAGLRTLVAAAISLGSRDGVRVNTGEVLSRPARGKDFGKGKHVRGLPPFVRLTHKGDRSSP